VAAALAVLPHRGSPEPRVIRQFTSIFLVNRVGELWRVYDSAARDGAQRSMPSAESTDPYRIFLSLARQSEVRVHTFPPNASRDVDPLSLQRQLEQSVR
jgi:hypothetical protein